MALDPEFKNFRGTVQFKVDKSDPNKYVVTEILWERGVKVGENTYTIDLTPVPPSPTDPFPDITGVYQRLHPTTYATDTSVVSRLDLTNPSVTSNISDISNAFTNCVSLTSVDFANDVTLSSDGYEHASYAFAGCRALTTVDIGDNMHTSDDVFITSMFEGCSSLTTITGVIDLSGAYRFDTNLKDVFKGCTNLQSVTIKNGEHCDLMEENVFVDGQTYAYAYEQLGLTADQMQNVVTLVPFNS